MRNEKGQQEASTLSEEPRQPVEQKVTRGLVFNSLRAVLSAVFSLVYSVVAVRYLHIQNFGVIAFLDSIFSLLGNFFMPLTHQAQQRFIPELLAEERVPQVRRLVSMGQRINLFLAFAFAFPFLVFASPIAQALGNASWGLYIQLMALGMIISAGLGIVKAILNAFYDQKFISLWESFFSFASLALLIVFVAYLGWGVVGAILVGLVTYGASWALYLYRINSRYVQNVRGERKPIGKTLEVRIRNYVVPNAAISLLSSFTSIYGGVFFLGILANTASVAYFDIPNTFVQRAFNQVNLVIGALGLVSLVEVNVRDPAKLQGAVRQFTKFVSIYALPVMAGGIVLASPIMTVLYGSQALPAVVPFQILLVAGCITTILQFSGTILFVFEKAYRAFLWNVVNAGILIGLSVLLIPMIGVMGAVVATFVSSVVTVAIFTYDASVRLRVGNFLPLGALLRMASAAFLMSIMIFGMGFVYPVVGGVSLAVTMVVGIVVFLFGVRYLRVFNDTDRRLVQSSSIPMKGLLIRLFWR